MYRQGELQGGGCIDRGSYREVVVLTGGVTGRWLYRQGELRRGGCIDRGSYGEVGV